MMVDLRSALLDGAECAVLYGSFATILSFGIAHIYRDVPPHLAFALLSLAILILIVGSVTAGLLLMLSLFGRRRSGALAGSVSPYIGVSALTVTALTIGLFGGQSDLVLPAGFATASIWAFAACRKGGQPSESAITWLRSATALMLLVPPFLSEQRPQWGWVGLLPIVSGFVSAGALAAGVLWAGGWLGLPLKQRGQVTVRYAVLIVILSAGLLSALDEHYDTPTLEWPVKTAASVTSRLNVVLITMDTVRADHLGIYGYSRNTTPRLQELLASGGTLYTASHAAGDYTLTSHGSIMTGLLPSHHGARADRTAGFTAICPGCSTLAERLQGAGFVTAGVAANFTLDPLMGFSRGFDYYDARRVSRPLTGWVVSRTSWAHGFQHNSPRILGQNKLLSSRQLER